MKSKAHGRIHTREDVGSSGTILITQTLHIGDLLATCSPKRHHFGDFFVKEVSFGRLFASKRRRLWGFLARMHRLYTFPTFFNGRGGGNGQGGSKVAPRRLQGCNEEAAAPPYEVLRTTNEVLKL